MGENTQRSEGSKLRWLYFFLGVFLAASVGLAIALIVDKVNENKSNDADNQSSAVVMTPKPTESTSNAEDDKPCVSASCVFRAGQLLTDVDRSVDHFNDVYRYLCVAGELLAAMDRSVDPCEDFYQYSCGQWLRKHSIPESESSYSRFGELRDSVSLELKDLLGKPFDSHTESESIGKAKKLYQSCLDEDKMKLLGPGPLKQLVGGLGTFPLTSPGWSPSALNLEAVLGKLATVSLSPLIDVGAYQDDANSSSYITWISQPGFGIDRDYMVKGRNSSEVTAYEELLYQLAVQVLNVASSTSLKTDIAAAVQFEVDLAKMSLSRADQRNTERYYRKMTISQLQTAVPKFQWLQYLSKYFAAVNITMTSDTEVAIFGQQYFNDMLDSYQKADKRVVANFLLMRIVNSYYGYLEQDIRKLNGPLRKVLYGVTETRARWKTCVDKVGASFMPTAVGQLYVQTYFTPEAKQKAMEMIGYIRDSMKDMISSVDWMDGPTKDKALEKADAIIQKIGYPDYQFNETVLKEFYKDVDYKADTYFQNGVDYLQLAVKENALNLNRVPDRNEWGDSASTVNAFYSPSDNTITFPAGILQPPFYGEDFPMSMMFGGIGMVIGHEMTHGFDDQGRKYDKTGNNVPWWSNTSVKQFETLTKCYVDQYGQSVMAGMHVNGHLTLGENIADNGGIKASFMAFDKWERNNQKQAALPGLGLSHRQLFFVNFAQGWCNLITDESAKNRILTDPHSPGKTRVRLSVSNSQQFADAFNCPAGSNMNPTKKCHLW